MLKTKNMNMHKYKEHREHDCSQIRKIETVTCRSASENTRQVMV